MRRMLTSLALAALVVGLAAPAWGETITLYSAGSLTKMVEALVKAAGPAAGVEVKTTFGPAGQLRARIEAGETPDLFLSADMAAPRKLDAEGRTVMAPIPFAQNRMCLLARRSLAVTRDNLVDELLAPATRLKTSTPVDDPAGDYAVAIFDHIDASRPGAGKTLREKAHATDDATKGAKALDGHSAAASLFLTNRIDLMITYCSGAPTVLQDVPEVEIIPFTSVFEPRPVDGMAILSVKPGALRLALYLLSEKGQALVQSAGLIPISAP